MRTRKRLPELHEQFVHDARAAKRQRVDEGLLRRLWDVQNAAELYQLLSQMRPSIWIINVRRDHLLKDALRQFQVASMDQLLSRSIKVQFRNEVGVDAGGLRRALFTGVAEALLTS